MDVAHLLFLPVFFQGEIKNLAGSADNMVGQSVLEFEDRTESPCDAAGLDACAASGFHIDA